MKNIIIIISLVFSVNTLIASTQLTRQGQLNTLQFNKVFYGDLILTTSPGQDSSEMIFDLSPLLQVDTIMGGLYIHNSALTDFSGLSNVVVTGGLYIYENNELLDLSSLDGPKMVDKIEIFENPKMKDCSSFSMDISFDALKIYLNPQLLKVQLDLANLSPTFRNTFYFQCNDNIGLQSIRLEDPHDLLNKIVIIANQSVDSIHLSTNKDSVQQMELHDLPKLVSVTGFKGVKYIGLVRIANNPKLEKLCFIKQVLEKESVGFLWLSNNGQGANSEAEILATDCTDFNTGITSLLNYDELKFYPNPANNEVYVGVQQQSTKYTIYDVSGKTVNQGLVESSGRISLETISNGMYVLMVGNKRNKLIVQ